MPFPRVFSTHPAGSRHATCPTRNRISLLRFSAPPPREEETKATHHGLDDPRRQSHLRHDRPAPSPAQDPHLAVPPADGEPLAARRPRDGADPEADVRGCRALSAREVVRSELRGLRRRGGSGGLSRGARGGGGCRRGREGRVGREGREEAAVGGEDVQRVLRAPSHSRQSRRASQGQMERVSECARLSRHSRRRGTARRDSTPRPRGRCWGPAAGSSVPSSPSSALKSSNT